MYWQELLRLGLPTRYGHDMTLAAREPEVAAREWAGKEERAEPKPTKSKYTPARSTEDKCHQIQRCCISSGTLVSWGILHSGRCCKFQYCWS